MHSPTTLSRREMLARLGVLLGGALIGGDTWLRGGTLASKSITAGFTAADLSLLDEVAETIIPTTATPGAKAAGAGPFMAMMVTNCYDDVHHAAFAAGLAQLRDTGFLAASPTERTSRLNILDAEQRRYQSAKATTAPAHYFKMMKQLTILGYFTSEIGASQILIYEEAPGHFDGSAPYQKGDRYAFTPPSRHL